MAALTFYSVRIYRYLPVDELISWLTPGSEEIVHLGRDYAIESIDDAMVILDETDVVVDINAPARELFGHGVMGQPVTNLDRSEKLLATDADGEQVAFRDEIWLETAAGQRYYAINTTPIEDGTGGTVGRVLLLQDITEMKEREEELGLLKDTMSRFLRHNIRNEMNIARSRVRMVHEQLEGQDGQLDEDLQEAIEIMDKIVERSGKARSVEDIAERTTGRVDLELQKLIRGVLSGIHDRYPDVELQYEPGEKTWVSASEHVDMAIENLVENAIEHNGAASKWVRVSTEDCGDTVEVHIEDNGPGIPEHEVDVLEEKQETDLQHGSGFGLWLVSWILDRSDGTVSFEVTDAGTKAVLTLKTVDRPDQ